MIVQREIIDIFNELKYQYPVLTLTGPRQSGKTTLAKFLFPDYMYVSLEDPDIRELAISDPRAFLRKSESYPGIVLDEIQRVPELTSYIQGRVDVEQIPGKYILTGSHQFDLRNSINQSLAGRTAILKLLPFSLNELRQIDTPRTTDGYLLSGFYPGIHDKKLNPTIACRNYFETYIERDLRQIINIKDLRLFRKFVRLCAGRIGQIFKLSSLANETGVSVPTINSWISVLEASFIIFLLEPWYANIGKRLIKSPKLYFYDTGLAAYLLGIETENQMERDPLRGNLFENMVIMELVKSRLNQGLDPNIYFYRDNNGNEVDIIYKTGRRLIPVEIKSAETFRNDFIKGLNYMKKIMPDQTDPGYVVYAGSQEQEGGNFGLINYEKAATIVD